MTQTIKVNRLGPTGFVTRNIELEEARKMIEEANFMGRLVVNKRTGKVIDEVTPDVEEIVIMEAIAGG